MSDDQTNPFTIAGMAGMMQPNKYIDPAYRNKPLPLPGYMGTPTDARGRPIQSFLDAQTQHDAWDASHQAATPGTTLNSSSDAGLEAQGSGARAMQNAGYGDWALLDPMLAQTNRASPTAGAGSVGATKGWNPANPASVYPTSGGGGLTPMGGSGSAGAGGASGGTNPVDMRQAYLTALSNPGKVTTQGATVPQAQPLGTPSVLDSFMAAHPGGGGGPAAGNYSNKGFFDTLKNLRSA